MTIDSQNNKLEGTYGHTSLIVALGLRGDRHNSLIVTLFVGDGQTHQFNCGIRLRGDRHTNLIVTLFGGDRRTQQFNYGIRFEGGQTQQLYCTVQIIFNHIGHIFNCWNDIGASLVFPIVKENITVSTFARNCFKDLVKFARK